MTYQPGGYGTSLFSQFPSLAAQSAGVSPPATPASYGGFQATGVPSSTFSSFGAPGGSLSTSPFSAWSGQDLNNIPQQAGYYTNQAVTGAMPYYTSGIGALQQYFGQAAKPYKEMIAGAQPGVQEYEAMLGQLGQGPQQDAIKAFMANPAMQSQLQLGDAAVRAQQAKAGGTGSGSELTALDQYNQQLGQQMWGQQLQALQPFIQQMQQGQTGLAGVRAAEGQGVSGGLNTIGGMMYGAPMTQLNYDAQTAMAAQNAASANMAALTGLGSGLFQGLGTALGGFLRSDITVKENIEPVGKLADGMNIYRYSYKDDPTSTPHIGLLAQEVEQVAPEAVAEIEPGVKGVNYARATDRAAALMKMTNDNVSSPLIIYGSGLMERAA